MTRWWKVTPRLAVAAACLLLAVAFAMTLYTDHQYRDQQTEAARVQAEILASAVTAALSFNDKKVALDYLGAMTANPEIVAAGVYDARGNLFASFRRADVDPLPTSVEAGSTTYQGTLLAITVPVTQSNVRLGTVYLRAMMLTFAQRLQRYAGLILLGVMALIMLGVLGAAQMSLNRANAELAARAADLETANANLREQMAEREKAEEALRQAQKMESIGQLTGGVAHDFNNLLAIILGNLDRVERRLAAGADPDQLRRAVANARTGAERAATLTRSLLAFSRRQPLQPQPIDANRLVSGMSELLRRTLGEQVTVETVLAGGLWRTSVDPNQLEIALLNLAVNARDAMPRGGKLTIETANAYLDAHYAATHDDVTAGQYVVICISDTGTGMSTEVMQHAFEPFFTTKDVGQGTGLGLSQVYGVVKQSGGHIKIYSEQGEGTTIKIYLPRLLERDLPQKLAAVSDRAETPAAAANRRRFPVLVVEDDEGVREHSTEVLAELGCQVYEAGDGAEALRLLESHPEIVLLFTDVGLPRGMNGRQLADEAKRRRPDLEVLYTTGYARNAIVHDGRLDPGVRLITKPFTYAELSAALDETLKPKRRAVLLVEDEALIRLATADDLMARGYEVFQAQTASEARSILDRLAGELGAVILDLGLPDNSGDDVLFEFRSRWPNLPAIVSSGTSGDALRPGLAEDTMVCFLQKPYATDTLVTLLQTVGVAASS